MLGVVNQLIGVSLYRRPVASLMMKPVATSKVREGSEIEEVPAVSVSSGLFFFFSCTLITWSFGVVPGWYSDCGLFPCKTNTGTNQDKNIRAPRVVCLTDLLVTIYKNVLLLFTMLRIKKDLLVVTIVLSSKGVRVRFLIGSATFVSTAYCTADCAEAHTLTVCRSYLNKTFDLFLGN